MSEQKEKVVVGRKKLKFVKNTSKYKRLDCVEGGPCGSRGDAWDEKHYLDLGVELPKDVDVYCVYYYEK